MSSSRQILIQELLPTDIFQVIKLMREHAYPELKWQHVTFSEEACFESIWTLHKNPDSKFFVALKNDNIIGYAACFVRPYNFSRELYATDVTFFVQKEHRGSLVGKKLIYAMRDFAEEKGANELFLSVNSGVEMERTEKMLTKLNAEKIGFEMTIKLKLEK